MRKTGVGGSKPRTDRNQKIIKKQIFKILPATKEKSIKTLFLVRGCRTSIYLFFFNLIVTRDERKVGVDWMTHWLRIDSCSLTPLSKRGKMHKFITKIISKILLKLWSAGNWRVKLSTPTWSPKNCVVLHFCVRITNNRQKYVSTYIHIKNNKKWRKSVSFIR